MKKAIINYLLTSTLITLSLSYNTYYNTNNFSTKDVKDNIAYLSSDDFKGRMTGTLENALVAAYIKDTFISNNVKPYDKDYLQNFQVNYPKYIEDTPMISVIDGNNRIVKTLDYGVNYKEDLLNFRINEIQFNKSNVLSSSDDFINVKTDHGSIILYTTEKDNLTFRNSFYQDSKHDLYVFITTKTLTEIRNYLDNDFSIYVNIPIKIEATTVSNVVGYIEGKNPSLPPLVFGSHFDHIGYDLGNTIYNGALDNASGTSFVLELSKYISSLGIPERDIIFVSFNAEEFGLLGSKAFVDKYENKLKGAKVINFDMIGSFDGIPLCIMGSKTDSVDTPFIKSLTSIFRNENIYFNYLFQDASDHAPFRGKDIEAVTLCDNDMLRIHTPNDKIDYISETAIKRCFNVVQESVLSLAYTNNILYNHTSLLLVISGISSLIFIFIRLKL